MKLTRLFATMLAVLAVAFGVAACGDDDKSSDEMKQDNAAMKSDDDAMAKDDDAMSEDDAMAEDDDAMMEDK